MDGSVPSPVKKSGCLGSLFASFFPGLCAMLACALLIVGLVPWLPADEVAATIVDRDARERTGMAHGFRYTLKLKLANGLEEDVTCDRSTYEGWPVGMEVRAEVVRGFGKIRSLKWTPDEQRRAEGYQPVNLPLIPRSSSWLIPVALAGAVAAVWLMRGQFKPGMPKVMRPAYLAGVACWILLGVVLARVF
jgi:hypothetical protein